MVFYHFVTEKLQIENKAHLSQGRGVKLKVLEKRVGLDGSVTEGRVPGLLEACVKYHPSL